MIKKIYKEDIITFCILLFTGIFLSIILKNEAYFDFPNYHYYNAFAFLYNREDMDIVPGLTNTFFNPLLDVPLWFYIQYFNDYPNILYALQGIWAGPFLFVLYKICLLFFEDKKRYFKASVVLLLTVTAQATVCQIGASRNEIPVAFFILWGLYILLKMIKFPETQALKKFFIAGLIMGIGLGLKQTVITYCIASGLTLIICYKYLNKPIKNITCFALGGLTGYLIINGYFMYKYWILYGNPFFPFLNGIFHSPYFFDFNFRDTDYLPEPLFFLIYPFIWYKGRTISTSPYYDPRLALFYILPIFMYFVLKKTKNFNKENKLIILSLVFCFLSFLLWMGIFSIMRYAVVIECIGAVLLVKLFDLYNIKKHPFLYKLHIFIVFVLVMFVFFYPSLGHLRGKHIDIPKISLPDNTLVKIYGVPTSFIIPELVKNKPNIKTVTYYKKCTEYGKQCPCGTGSDFAEYGKFKEKRDKIEKEHTGPVVYIYHKNFDVFKTEEQINERHNKIIELRQRAKALGFIQTIENPFEEQKYLDDLAIAREYSIKKSDYYCQPLTNNLRKDLNICVPKKLKKQILGK